MRLTAGEIANLTQGELHGDGEIAACNAVYDSGSARPGSMFICIKGQNADGHDFADKAIANGATVVLAEKALPDISAPVIVVPDAVKALGRLAKEWRARANAKVIAIAGTAGKTTVKDMLARILQNQGSTAKSEKNHNNQIGLPCSILNASGQEKYWVMEIGISKKGDMETLGEILSPDLALILNVGEGHAEGLGKEGAAWHKTRLLNYLAKNGEAVFSADYPQLTAEVSKSKCKKTFFSLKYPESDYSILVRNPDEKSSVFKLNRETCSIAIPHDSDADAENMLAVMTVAHILGMDAEQIEKCIGDHEPSPHRFCINNSKNWLIIDDSYNANPLSMLRSLDAAAKIAAKNNLPLVLALGEMGELGNLAKAEHKKLGEYIAGLNPAAVFWKGDFFEEILGAGLRKNPSYPVIKIDSPEEFENFLKDRLQDIADRGAIIFKGSRSNKLENFLEIFNRTILQTETADVL